ncbi:MAG TPA: hypothetical protein VHY22_06525 [Chthoniobacteraceae bacterium]|jgi:hypothetical protein|nr:hypothetical protein [Chthoniobacteraceae bacterium]
MMTKKKKAFDAVEMSRQWRVETGRLLAAMTPREQMEFLNRNAERYPNARVQSGREAGAPSTAT